MNTLALIPARSGSKSIQNKNILPYKGHPLFFWSVHAAQNCSYITDVVVTSDSEQILEDARRYGAVPLHRPSELATDYCRDISYLTHFYRSIDNLPLSVTPDLVLILRPTCPDRNPRHIESAIEFFSSLNTDSLRSLSLATQTPFKMWFRSDTHLLTPVITHCDIFDHFNAPRQILPPTYWQDGYLELIKYSSLGSGRYPGTISGWLTPVHATDIDHISDLPADMRESLILNPFHTPIDSSEYSS